MKQHKHVLVTGAAGFIGTKVIEELERGGIPYTAVDKHGEKSVNIDLSDKNGLNELVCAVQPDVVLHLAAIALVTHKNVAEIYNVNVCGTENLLEAVKLMGKPQTRVVLASTAGVYGNQDVRYYDETLPLKPVNHYSYSKMVMEMLSDLYRKDMQIKIIRPFNIIGTGQSESFFIPKLVHAFATRTPVLSLGNISSERDYVEASFIAQVIKELVIREQIPHDVYNICMGVAHTGYQVIDTLKEITGFEPKVEITNEFTRPNEVWRLVGNPERIEKFMNMSHEKKPRTLKEILSSMLEIYKTKND